MTKFRKKVIIIFFGIILAILFLPQISLAADWYVDNAAIGVNNGTSWSGAWQSFASINWNLIQPGDTVYISGGTTSKTYNERLTIGTSGAQGNPIIIKIGQDAGHNGSVIIDGDYIRLGIRIGGRKHITINGQVGLDPTPRIRVTEGSNPCIDLQGTTTNIKFLYLEVDNVNYSGSDWDRLINIGAGASYADLSADGPIEIAYSKLHDTTDAINIGSPLSGASYASDYGKAVLIHNNDIFNIRDDGITLGLGSVDIYNNSIRDRISPIEGHPDGIQMWGRYYRIYNNYFHGWNDVSSGNSVVYYEPDGGNNMNLNNNQPGYFILYNNVFYEDANVGGTSDSIELGFSDPDWTSLSNVYVLNNTIVGNAYSNIALGWSGTQGSISLGDIYIMNNVFSDVQTSNLTVPFGSLARWGTIGSGSEMILDYNFYESFSSPTLNANHKPDQLNDPEVNIGYNWSSIFTIDKDDNNRPQGTTWDIGAYEYVEATPPPALKGDFNSDSKVNNADFLSLKNVFKNIVSALNAVFDLNSDSAIDVRDLGVLMSSWLP